MNEELLYNQLYEKTKDCGRAQFVRLLMDKERENKELKEQIQQKEYIINKAKEYIKNNKRNLIHEITHEEYEMLDEENIVNLLEILDNKGEWIIC